MHLHLNQLDHRDTYTNSETNLSLLHISIEDSQNVILYYNSYLRATQQVGILFGFTLYRVLKNNIYNVSGMIEEVKTNMFLFDKTLAYAPFCR